MRKPWETEELSEDWIEEEESKEEEEIKEDNEEKVEELKNQSVRRKRGYGTVKINTIGKPTTISFSAIKTLQEGGTLVIHENKNDSVKSQSTIKANKESKLKWNMKNKDFFTPLSLEVMFEKPKEKIMKNISPSKIPLVKNSPNLAPCLSNGKLLASPLRRISAHRGVHFKLNSRDPSPYTLEPRNLPFNLNIKEVPDRPHTAPQGLIKEEKMKRSVSNEGGRINNKTNNTSNLELFPSQYDLDTQNNLSQLLNQLDGSESDKTSSLSQGSSSEKGIKRMVSAPNLSGQLNNRPSPFRMLTPHPPTWEWLKMQSESECSAINEGEYVNQNNSFSFDEDINEHDWLKELPLEIGDLSEPRSSSTLSKKSNNLATPNQNQPKQMITNEIITNSFRKEMNLSSNNNNANNKIKNNSPISMELWEEFFKTKQSKLGPDRVAEQLKKYGILPYYYLDSYPVLIQPHQLGNVPKLVNNMKFDSLNLKWKPLMEDEDDPFKSIKTLKLNSTEFKNMINAAKGNNNNILNNSNSILNINTNSNILNTNTNNMKRKVELNKYLKQNQENANLDLDLDLNAFLSKDNPASLDNNLNEHKSNINNLLKDNLNQEEEEEESLTEFLNNKTQLNESISSVDSNDNKDSDNEEDEEEVDLKAFLNKNKNKESKILNKKESIEINTTKNHVKEYNDEMNSRLSNNSKEDSSKQSININDSSNYSFPKKSYSLNNTMKLMVDKHTQTYDLEREDSMNSIDFNYWNFYFISMDHLTSVKLKYCKLKDMKVFHQLKNLKHLNLSHNHISVIYGTFLNLIDFDISYNSLNNVSFSTLNQIMPNLKRINLENNQLTKLKLSPSKLESIKVNNNNITRVYGQNNNLIKLNLSGTSISKLPCLKLTCSNLKKLSLNNLNDFTLPPFNDLKNIHFLSLSYSKFNAIKNISSISTTPSNLKYLISKNSPSVFPLLEQWDPVMFINLQYLDISDNRLSYLPSFILDKCNNLIALEANDNQIKLEKEVIPNQLFFLSLKNNLINNIEAFINCKNVNLTCLDLRFNPLLENFKSDQQTKVLFWAFKAWFPNLSKFLGKRW